MNTNTMSMKELSLNELENVNGANFFDWLAKNIAVPIVSKVNEIDDNMDKNAEKFREKYCKQ